VRSSKTRAMFAMRACRKSTMVGASLNAKQMRTVGFFFGSRLFTCHSRVLFSYLTYDLLFIDHSAHGNHGATVELSPRAADDETFVGCWGGGEERGEGC
jgi:hypothetical protein